MAKIKTPFPELKIKVKEKQAICLFFKALIYALSIFGAICILLLLAFLGAFKQDIFMPGSYVPEKAILRIDFDDAFNETRNDSLLSEMNNVNPLSFNELLMVLEYAGIDDRVKALAARINVSNLGMAQLQELFVVIKEFRARGKKAYIFAPGFGGMSGGISEYYLATAFDEITMQPNTEAGISAIRAEVPFFRNVLDKIGITPEFFSRYEHKNAMISFTDKNLSTTFKVDMNMLIAFLNIEMVSEMLKERFPMMTSRDMLNVMDQAPYSAEGMMQRSLIDKIAFESDWIDSIEKEYDAESIDLIDYAYDVHQGKKGPEVATLIIEGNIVDGESSSGSLSSEAVVGARTVLEQLKEISDNENVKAVLVRINSPGGSYNAANEIWYALEKLKKERKIPVIVSMGNYAASGGYFIALAGDKIFADVSTITGSIGVLGGKFALEDMWKKLGVNWAAFDATETSGIDSINFKFTPKQKKAFNDSLDRVYADFTAKVAKARGIDIKKLDDLARGRVWTGSEAKKNNLVDEIGGFNQALSEAKKKAGISGRFNLTVYPKQKTLQEKIREAFMAYPSVSAQKIKSQLGLDFEELNVLKRLQYDAVMMPFIIRM